MEAADHSEQCRSRMEAILVTTTEGHERLERARDRFAQAAKEREDGEPQRKRHRPEGEGGQPLAPTTRKVAAVAGSALPPPPPLEPPLFAQRSLEQETEMTDETVEQQGEPKRRREHPEARQAADSSSVAAAAVKAQPTLKWAWWMCVRFSVEIPRGKPVAIAEGRAENWKRNRNRCC